MFLNCFDADIKKNLKIKKINLFSNKKHFKKQSTITLTNTV